MPTHDKEGKLGYAASFKEQFTLRAVLIGCVGAVVLTMSSMFVALKLGALPWPIIFVALVSMFFLKALGKTNYNEINVAHTTMSAGAMTAGGLAFTLPGLFMVDRQATVDVVQLFAVVLGGVILGCIFTALIRKYFVVTQDLPYPMGVAAAETVMVGDEGDRKSFTLFASLGVAGVFTLARDWFMAFPAVVLGGGVWLSPMLCGVGYIVGPVAIGVWFLGALIGSVGIATLGAGFGLFSPESALAAKESLGIGLMVGTGAGIIVKGVLPKLGEIFAPLFKRDQRDREVADLRWAPLAMAALACVFAVVCDMGVLASVITILGVWLATSMSAQVVGQSGINPMEVFGIIVLLAAKALSPGMGTSAMFFVAAVVAIACGLAGDVMNDFKAGRILKTSPKAQWLGECIGGVVGAVVTVAVFSVILKAYGPAAFGNPDMFVAPQAGMVAAMVGGIKSLPWFWAGLGAGTALYIAGVPVATLGLGVYLPFYLSSTVFVGGALKFVVQKLRLDTKDTGLIVASGLLGGEAVVGVVIALIQAFQGIMAMG